MELRTILFGYKKEQFAYFIEETEAQLVREIFTRYISGETLLQIANDFTVRQVTYYCKKSKGIEEKRLHEAICRALRKMVEESASVISLIKADLAYGLSGDEGTYDVGALEKSISDATTDLNDYMKQCNSTGGDKTKYIECIQQTSEKIRLLRIELDTAKAKISQNEKINQEVERLTKWLTEHDVSFESYDDVVVRRMVELIRVNNDNTITVFSKFGSEIVENL